MLCESEISALSRRTCEPFQQVNFVISPLSNSVSVRPGGETTFNVPVTDIGVFVSAHGEYSNQFQVQTRAEFGYAEWPGVKGIAYNLSLMTGALEGLKIQPTRSDCAVKSCPDVNNCPADQGWTNPNQAAIGSPADTGCYNGPTDFIVTFCP